MDTSRAYVSSGSKKERNDPVTVTRGDHLIALYATDHERLTLAVPFLLDGLRKGSACFLIGPDSSGKGILAELRKTRPALDDDIRAGRLVVAEHQNSPPEQFEFLQSRICAAERAGLHTFRFFGDMMGARRHMSFDQILGLQRRFDETIVHRHEVAAMCSYDVRGFSGVELLAALRSHRGPVRYADDDSRDKTTK